MASFFAFLHYIAVFSLVAALAIEFVLIRNEINIKTARMLQASDLVYGISAVTVLIAGGIRVFYFEKGAYYYFHSTPFILKLSLFLIAGLISIYPTIQFLAWGPQLRKGSLPVIEEQKLKLIRRIIHWEFIIIILLALSAVLTADGIGYFGYNLNSF